MNNNDLFAMCIVYQLHEISFNLMSAPVNIKKIGSNKDNFCINIGLNSTNSDQLLRINGIENEIREFSFLIREIVNAYLNDDKTQTEINIKNAQQIFSFVNIATTFTKTLTNFQLN